VGSCTQVAAQGLDCRAIQESVKTPDFEIIADMDIERCSMMNSEELFGYEGPLNYTYNSCRRAETRGGSSVSACLHIEVWGVGAVWG
jgi:hypothetical protein